MRPKKGQFKPTFAERIVALRRAPETPEKAAFFTLWNDSRPFSMTDAVELLEAAERTREERGG